MGITAYAGSAAGRGQAGIPGRSCPRPLLFGYGGWGAWPGAWWQEAHDVLAMARGLGYPAGEMVALTALGVAARYLGDIEQALEWHRQASQIDPAQVPGRRARECTVP